MAAAQPLPPQLEAYHIRAFVTEDGLLSNHVLDLARTPDGYVYVANGQGLSRFDGFAFHPVPLPGFASTFIRRLHVDPAGRLWLLSQANEVGYLDDAGLHRLPVPPDSVAFLLGSTAEATWMGGYQGLWRLAPGTPEPVTHFARRQGLPADTVLGLVALSDGAPIAVTMRGLARLEPETTPKGPPRFVPFGPSLRIGGDPRQVRIDARGLWMVEEDGVLHYADGRFRRYGPAASRRALTLDAFAWPARPGPTLSPLFAQHLQGTRPDAAGRSTPRLARIAHDGTHWVVQRDAATDQDRLWWRRGADAFEALGLRRHLDFRHILQLVEDQEGNFWVGTDRGLLQVAPRSVAALTTRHGLADGFTVPVLQTRDEAVWIGTWGGGLHRFQDGRLARRYTTADGLADDRVRALFEATDGTLWIGTVGGASALHPDGRMEAVLQDLADQVHAFAEDTGGRLWIGTRRGLFTRSPDGRWQREAEGPAAVWALHVDREGALWAGTEHGLHRRHAARWQTFGEADGLQSPFVVSVYEEADGTLWFGTYNRGLHRYRDGRFAALTTAEGLHWNGVWRMLEDGLGGVWMSSDQGIFHLPHAALHAAADAVAQGRAPVPPLQPLVFTEAEGMPSRECNRASVGGWRLRDGRLLFNNQQGAAVIDPVRATRPPPPPPMVLQSVTADGQALPRRRLSPPTLRPGTKHVAFGFAALSFVAPQQNRYRYRLEGYDGAWIEAGTERRAAYTNLPPGHYIFHVQGASGAGPWRAPGARYAFAVQPFFWQTAWFRLAVATLVLLAGLALLTRQRRRRRRLEREVAARTAELQAEKTKTEEQAALLEAQAVRLKALDEAKNRFFANLSHELRTPLTNVSLVLDLLARQLLDVNGQAALEQARTNLDRAARLNDDLLILARRDVRLLRPAPARADLVDFLARLAEAYMPLAERRRLTLHTDLPPAPYPADFDPKLLQHVLGNLLENALKFTEPGGKARLGLHDDADGTYTLVVEDTGIGIEAAHLGRLFERFYQVNGAAGRAHEGLGLGLAVVKEVVTRLNGTLRVDSTPGMGSTFSVRLARWDAAAVPARPEQAEVAAPVAAAILAPAPPASEGPRILVVEDNADTRSLLQRLLGVHYRVDVAADGEEALRRLAEAPPDLLLSDVMMPGLDGLSLLEAVRADPRLHDLPVLLLTARAEQADRVAGLHAGADVYLEKPFDADELLAQVQHLIASREALRARYAREVVVQPVGLTVTPAEAAFLEQARQVVEGALADVTVRRLADALAISPQHLRRRLKTASGLSPSAFIREMRMQHGAALLAAGADNVEQTARRVGYRDADTFRKHFKRRFGTAPSQYASASDASS